MPKCIFQALKNAFGHLSVFCVFSLIVHIMKETQTPPGIIFSSRLRILNVPGSEMQAKHCQMHFSGLEKCIWQCFLLPASPRTFKVYLIAIAAFLTVSIEGAITHQIFSAVFQRRFQAPKPRLQDLNHAQMHFSGPEKCIQLCPSSKTAKCLSSVV